MATNPGRTVLYKNMILEILTNVALPDAQVSCEVDVALR